MQTTAHANASVRDLAPQDAQSREIADGFVPYELGTVTETNDPTVCVLVVIFIIIMHIA